MSVLRCFQPKDTLCWTCARADDRDECCWADGVPRTDWDATATKIKESYGYVDSFVIHSCPDYISDNVDAGGAIDDSRQSMF